jgi:hypothetical protein
MPDDYSKPGDDGGQVPPSIGWNVEERGPRLKTPVACNTWYGFEVLVAQGRMEQRPSSCGPSFPVFAKEMLRDTHH